MKEPSNAPPLARGSAQIAAVAHREQVLRVMAALEAALAAPAPGRLAQWCEVVARRVHELRGEFARHVEITEGDDGLYDEILSLAPGHARALDGLRHEHDEIEGAIRRLLVALAARAVGGDTDAWVAQRRADGTDVLGRLARHRQRGADLTWRAFNTDIGAG